MQDLFWSFFGIAVRFDPVLLAHACEVSPPASAVGSQVRIWGYNMLRAMVAFNGVAASTVQNSGPNYVWATVPAGATTGPITITTPGGTSTTQASFTVK
jgi:hypothetical protein